MKEKKEINRQAQIATQNAKREENIQIVNKIIQ